MNLKWISGIAIVLAGVASLYFIVKGNLNYAVLAMTALFTMTNGFRAKSFREQGFERQSKWMAGMASFFGIAFIGILIYIVWGQ
ncbi:cation transport ATPase [Bacillus sp. OxB-1]|uniref:hypothetical protein n=1 Tax=Bacillus sp. (strain OxB-1) TaxID=98228 RepID=UPI000581DB94|nr:hypothetical protein [Bacillus sp. OxB-1]BAQ08963.1 cation transport ATPase [Bacillus sp. OxB-1]